MSNLPKVSEEKQSLTPQEVTSPSDQILEHELTSRFGEFRYSYREVSVRNGQTHLKARESRWQNGQLQTEELEGTLTGNEGFQIQQQMQRQFQAQLQTFFRWSPFSPFLPTRPLNDTNQER